MIAELDPNSVDLPSTLCALASKKFFNVVAHGRDPSVGDPSEEAQPSSRVEAHV
jgi:hypothetical protein